MYNTLRVENTAMTFGVVNCTNMVLCPDVQDFLRSEKLPKNAGLQIYPFDCCWKHAADKDTFFVLQDSGTVAQSSSNFNFSSDPSQFYSASKDSL